MTKQALYESLGKIKLNWTQLKEVLLETEVNMSNYP